jgi:hypothetical protein
MEAGIMFPCTSTKGNKMAYRLKFYELDVDKKTLYPIFGSSKIPIKNMSKWQSVKNLDLCHSGFHCCSQSIGSLLKWAPSSNHKVIALVEMGGNCILDIHGQKEVWNKQRVLCIMTFEELQKFILRQSRLLALPKHHSMVQLFRWVRRTKSISVPLYSLYSLLVSSMVRKWRRNVRKHSTGN